MRFWRRKFVTDKQTDIGSILLRMGILDEKQLETAIAQQGDDMMLGALLVGRGYVTEDQLREALDLQKRMRKGDAADAMLEIAEKRVGAHHRRLKLAEVKP